MCWGEPHRIPFLYQKGVFLKDATRNTAIIIICYDYAYLQEVSVLQGTASLCAVRDVSRQRNGLIFKSRNFHHECSRIY